MWHLTHRRLSFARRGLSVQRSRLRKSNSSIIERRQLMKKNVFLTLVPLVILGFGLVFSNTSTAEHGYVSIPAAAPAAHAPQPDGLAPQDVYAAPVPGGPTFLMISSYQFKARSYDAGWSYDGLGLYNLSNGPRSYDAALTLSNKVTITKLVVYFYDNSTSDLTVSLWRGDPATGISSTMATVATSDAQDLYRNLSNTSISDATVDQQSYSYIITVDFPGEDSSLRLVAVRVDYSYGVVLPLVLQNHPGD